MSLQRGHSYSKYTEQFYHFTVIEISHKLLPKFRAKNKDLLFSDNLSLLY